MALQIRKAERRKAKLRLGLAAPAGGGKTYGALQLAFGLGGRVGMIDTEHGSGDLYAHLGEYDVITLNPPYSIAKYLEAIHAFEEAGHSVLIIDSLSHAWAGEGGLLDKQGQIADKDPRANSYTAWRKITPEHNSLVDAMLASKCHVIGTMRSKQEYVQDKDSNGKTVIRKVGMAPVQREGMEYEFTVMLDLDQEHNATTTKDRTGILDGRIFKLSKKLGQDLLAWLDTGIEPPKPEVPLLDMAKTYAELLKGAEDVLFLDNEVLAHASLMNELAKTEVKLYERLLQIISEKRAEFAKEAEKKKTKVKTASIADELNDEIPAFLKPTEAQVNQNFEEAKNKNIRQLKEDMRDGESI